MATYLENLLEVSRFKNNDKYFPLVTNYEEELDKEVTVDLKN